MRDIPVQKIVKLCHDFAVQPTPQSFLHATDLWSMVQKILDVSVGLLTIYIIKLKWEQNKKESKEIKYLEHQLLVKRIRSRKAL